MELELKPLNLPSDKERPSCVIAGPCSAETEEQVLTISSVLEFGNHVLNQVVLKVMVRRPCRG